jgi:chromosome partitioning protein
MSIVMSVNLKGGVAKTTTSVAVVECLAASGYRTLLIDADHQCMAGELLLGEDRQVKADQNKRNLYCLFMDTMFNETDLTPEEFEKCITRQVSNIGGGLEKLAVLPCSIRMDEIDDKIRERMKKSPELARSEIRERLKKRRGQFGKWLKQEFDFVIIDCPPSFGFPVKYFLSIADGYVVPCVPDRLSVRGSLYLMDRIKKGGYKVHGIGTLWSLFRKENILHRNRVEGWGKGLDADLDCLPRPFETIIPNATKIAEAAELVGIGNAPTTFRNKYTLAFARLFEDVSKELLQRVQWQHPDSSNSPVPTPAAPAEANDEELRAMGRAQLHVLAGRLGLKMSPSATGNSVRTAIMAARATK